MNINFKIFGFAASIIVAFSISSFAQCEKPEMPKAEVTYKAVVRGKIVKKVKPKYPKQARKAKVEGTVCVDVLIDVNGKVISAVAYSGPTILREAAVAAALKTQFSPTIVDGIPSKVSGFIVYNFDR